MSRPPTLSTSAVDTILWIQVPKGCHHRFHLVNHVCQNVVEADYYLSFPKLPSLCIFFSFHIYGVPKYNHAKTLGSFWYSQFKIALAHQTGIKHSAPTKKLFSILKASILSLEDRLLYEKYTFYCHRYSWLPFSPPENPRMTTKEKNSINPQR